MLMFRSAVYTNVAGRSIDDETLVKAAASLANQSVLAATPATWMRSLSASSARAREGPHGR